MFQPGYVLIVLASAVLGLQLYSKTFVQPPMGALFESYLNSCAYSKSNPFYSIICVLEPLFKDLVGNEIAKSFMTACGTVGAVMSTYLFLKGGEPGASPALSPLITIAHTLAGQFFGAGIVGPILLPLIMVLSKTYAPRNAPSPSPPTYAYTVTLLFMQFTVFSLAMALSGVPPTSASWPYVNYAFQAFPLLFLPLALFPTHTKAKGNSTTPPPTPIPTLSISTFTVMKYLYGPLWWVTLAQGLNAYFRLGETFSPACRFIALDYIGFVWTFVAMYAVDAVAGEAQVAMSVQRLLISFVATGPASTMAAYFEAKQRLVVERAESERARKG
ncbi:hypothetical protein MVEN_00894300 [Mycena venus]|uniref:Uncharacterized protein n=1 Tax=Mycena venus TaxID=2733690 RepID=A0A8H7D4G7_9AGAR|nr:hypothetical protein MVEN_00894300 [Mycena venus]